MSLLNLWSNKKSNNITFLDEFQKGISLCSSNSEHFFNSFKDIYTNIFNQNIKDSFTSPKIYVIGTQSSGKSSLLENITKTPIFPKRKQGIGTKTPVKLILNSNDSNKHVFSVNGQTVNGEHIIDQVEKIFDELGDNYNSTPIEVKISNQSLIDSFEFYDLPGIVAYPEDKRDFTEKLTEEYIKDDNNIILCVIPITITDLSSCFTISLIKKYKREKNTIIVFTMADKVQREDIGDLIISRILNESSEIKITDYLGVNIIINRNEKNETSLENLDLTSKKWFQENILDIIPDNHSEKINVSNKLGIDNLINNLNIYYKEFIDKNWIPNTQDKIQLKIKKLLKENKKLGLNFYDDSEIKLFDFEKYKFSITTQLLDAYYVNILENIMMIKYQDYYDFDKYFDSLLKHLDSMISLDCREITLPMFTNNKYKYWRLSHLNNLISQFISEMFMKKLLYYLKTQKTHILASVIESLTSNRHECERTYDKHILKIYLDFVKMEIIYSKEFFCEQLDSLNTPENLCENITVLTYRINIIKQIYNLNELLNKLNVLKSGKEIFNNLGDMSKMINVMEDNLKLQLSTKSDTYKNSDTIIATEYNKIINIIEIINAHPDKP